MAIINRTDVTVPVTVQTPDGSGTVIRWTYEFKPLPGRRFVLRGVIAPLWRRYMIHGVTGTAREAERIAAQE